LSKKLADRHPFDHITGEIIDSLPPFRLRHCNRRTLVNWSITNWTMRCFTAAFCVSAIASTSFADIYGYWPLDAAPGNVSPNLAGGTAATLNGGASIVADPTRGQVLSLSGAVGVYASAGSLPTISPSTDFTWSFWARQTQGDPPAGENNVILGNRVPDAGWIKFTPANFEFRDIAPTFNNGINTPELTAAQGWTHNAVVKSGNQMFFYRNGIASGYSIVNGTVNSAPFYMGGDAFANENWGGLIDDVGLWTNALPVSSVVGLSNGTYTPANAPLTGSGGGGPSVFQPIFEDTFDEPDLSPAWTPVDKGLEQVGPAGYNAPSVAGNHLTLGGTTTNQYWYGSSVQISGQFATSVETEIVVDRVSISGAGSAFRSSLWILGDDGHYLHFSQNVNEGGWSYNANDVGGLGTNNPTGSGVNIAMLDGLDGSLGDHEMRIVVTPTGQPGDVNMAMYLDGTLVGVQGFSNFPESYTVMLTGQGRAIGDNVSAVFDNFRVGQAVPIPEPSTIVLFACAVPVLARGLIRRRNRRS
jgi:hypothetical protein